MFLWLEADHFVSSSEDECLNRRTFSNWLYCLYGSDDDAIETAVRHFSEMAGEETLVTDIDEFIAAKGFSPQWMEHCWKAIQLQLFTASEGEECTAKKSYM